MKHILIILMAFIVSASAQAQTKLKSDSTNVHQPKAGKVKSAAKDTVIYTLKLNTEQLSALFSILQSTIDMLPRSADMTALQASETQKQIAALGKILADQLPKPVNPQSIKDTINTK